MKMSIQIRFNLNVRPVTYIVAQKYNVSLLPAFNLALIHSLIYSLINLFIHSEQTEFKRPLQKPLPSTKLFFESNNFIPSTFSRAVKSDGSFCSMCYILTILQFKNLSTIKVQFVAVGNISATCLFAPSNAMWQSEMMSIAI